MLKQPGFSFTLAIALFSQVAASMWSPSTAQADLPEIIDTSISSGIPSGGPPPLPPGAVLVETATVDNDRPNQVADLLREIDRAREELDVDRLPNLEQSESEVIERMAAVEGYFRRNTDSTNYDAWMRYLQLDPLRDAIQANESIAQRGRPAVELEARLRGLDVGLELAPMVALRTAIQRYIAALRYSDPKRGIASIEKQLDAIAKLFASETKPTQKPGTTDDGETTAPATSPQPLSTLSFNDVAMLEQLLGGLSDANQAERLVAKIRSHYSKPNFRGWVDGRTITDALTRPVNNPKDVNECILGTKILGRSRVQGNVTAQLLPSDGYVRVLVRIDGLFTSDARGYSKPITLDTTGTGNVYAARQFAITEDRIILGDTVATADLSTRVNRINHPLKIVRKIARRKAAEQRPLAEAISRDKLRNQIFDQFDEQTAEAAARTFPSIDDLIDPWFRRLDFPPLTRTIGSTTEAVYARANLQRPTGLAALLEPPPLSAIRSGSGTGVHPGGYFSAVQIHQSILDNTVANLLAGQTLSPAKIDQLITAMGIVLPTPVGASPPVVDKIGDVLDVDIDDISLDAVVDAATTPPPREEFEVDLANFRPVFVEAVDQSLRIGLRGTRFSQGDRELKRTLEVAATYRPVIGDDGNMWLIRDEEVDLSFPGTRRLTISQTAIKTNMEKSFNDLFPRELLHRSFPVPSTVKAPALAGRVLKVSAIDFTDGWISIALR
ncbi:hypothetical protein [Aporhodopirellula aestuarii]|uniref:Secreted protein n=1 Tax=Aporhodopirellula aestuarii TaxID=2950107 RepID=A0ABT0U5T3_9BACT|nr:hypothetical protein [Aporhodopirellula aestuarii]MCM2372289.1 hypothetical protein [Aporhodopirellula aestuarii]